LLGPPWGLPWLICNLLSPSAPPGPSWASLGPLWILLNPHWGLPGPSLCTLQPSFAFVTTQAFLDLPRASLSFTCPSLGPSWAFLGSSANLVRLRHHPGLPEPHSGLSGPCWTLPKAFLGLPWFLCNLPSPSAPPGPSWAPYLAFLFCLGPPWYLLGLSLDLLQPSFAFGTTRAFLGLPRTSLGLAGDSLVSFWPFLCMFRTFLRLPWIFCDLPSPSAPLDGWMDG
jgi:hypothetical protein